jgi:hypothetical protein
VDIVFTIYGIRIFANIIISVCFVSWATSFWGVAMTIATWAKVVSYHDRYLEDDFILLAIKIFGCLHQQVNDFFHQCVNIAWLEKGFGGPSLLILNSFYR